MKVIDVFTITGKHLRYASEGDVDYPRLKQNWGKALVNHFNIKILMNGKPCNPEGPTIFIGNHISYLDIPIILFTCPHISFVSKKQIRSWPVIGKAAAMAQTIFVERENAKSRASAKEEITNSLINNNQKVVIFPSGTTSILPTDRWKKGAFDIAEKNSITIQPFRIKYSPLRDAAYIDNDNFITHMFKLFNFKRIEVTLEFHEPVQVTNSLIDCNHWKNWCEHQF